MTPERARIEAKSLFTELKREGDAEDPLDIARWAWEHYSEDERQMLLSEFEALLPLWRPKLGPLALAAMVNPPAKNERRLSKPPTLPEPDHPLLPKPHSPEFHEAVEELRAFLVGQTAHSTIFGLNDSILARDVSRANQAATTLTENILAVLWSAANDGAELIEG